MRARQKRGPHAAHQGHADTGNTVHSLSEGPRHALPCAVSRGEAVEDVVTADQPDRDDRIVVGDGQSGET